jgi:hypothetical protein
MKFVTQSGGWANQLTKAQQFQTVESAKVKLRKRSGAIFTESELRKMNYI